MSAPRRLPRRWARYALAVTAAAALACTPAREPAEEATLDVGELAFELLDNGNVELVDLGWPLSPEGLYWPTGAPFEHQVTAGESEDGYWYASGSFSAPEHLGTHVDAPSHFAENGWASAEIPLRRLFGRGALIDISDRAAANADATLAPADIEAWEGRHGALRSGSIVLVRTGWSSRWPDAGAYYGTETPQDVTTLHFPGVSPAAAEVLVARGIAAVGIDTASIDPGTSTDFRAHRILAADNIYNLENLNGLEALPETGFGVIALPMKIEDGTGGPARVVAVVPR